MAEADFEVLVDALAKYAEVSKTLGGAVAEQADLFMAAVSEEKNFISKAISMKKPSDDDFQKLLSPISDKMTKIVEIKEKNRKDANFNHLSAVGEGVQALGWVCVEPTPGPFAKEAIGAAQFWTNKILKDFKGKDEKHVEWVNSFVGFLQELPKYILKFHTTGVAWNSGGSKPAVVAVAAAPSGGSIQEELDALIADFVDPFVEASTKIGGVVAEQAAVFKQAVSAERDLVVKAATTPKKPSAEDFQAQLEPISNLMTKVGEFKDKNRGKPNFDHLSAVAEGVPILGWVCVEPTPGPYAKETIAGAQFYTNKVLKEWRGKDANQELWVKSFVSFLEGLHKYIVAHHTTGLSWGTVKAQPAAAAVAAPTSGPVAAYDDLVNEHFNKYLELSKKLGGLVQQQAELLNTAVVEERKLIDHAAKTKPKPKDDDFFPLLEPISAAMGKVGEIKEKNRKDAMFDHLSAVAEGVSTLGWVAVSPAPAPYAKESAASSVFYTNKILKVYRGKDENHVQWVQALNGFFGGFEAYIKQNHMTGLSWGVAAGQAAAPVVVASSSSSGFVADFEDLVEEHLKPYQTLSGTLGDPVSAQANLFMDAVKLEVELLKKASSQKKPSDDDLQALLGPISELMTKVAEVKDKNRGHKLFNHLNAVAEGVQVLGWVCVEPTPAPFVKDLIGGSEFWSNKVLKDHKGVDDHVNWVKGFNGFMKALPTYILQHHTTGLSWKKN
eukprot:TRINITY_DN6_c0_g1_i1.p1 TRINITY_DN6_c0_g1~~TRINITY_DN6_c0_g1_i1.p1  ORF type:complete len:723 (-),score=287.52 TRINITY_DN6_c0_g1_i1:100-2268(-)